MSTALDAASWTTTPGPALAELRAIATELATARSIGDLLYWDDRVERPERAAPWRAAQRAAQAGLVHDLVASERLARAIAAVEDVDATDLEARAMRRERVRLLRIPRELHARREAVASVARAAWDRARIDDDFTTFEPHLAEMVGTIREIAEAVGYEREPYEAVLDEWEPGIELGALDGLFAELEGALRPMLARRNTEPKELTLRTMGPEAMHELERRLLDAVGFDHAAGRVVESTRAFCIALGPHDVRMTSRFHVTPCFRGIHSTLHEAGHAIYAQSFGRLDVPDTLALAPGLGLDESQSRMIENVVGRSRPFLAWTFAQLRELAPDAYPDAAELDRFVAEVNTADSPYRRLGTDELSYNLHILLRTRVERELVNGTLEVRDLPEAWRVAAQDLLGVTPERDVDGCLQDVHWSLGQWGYFPTYTLGNLYGMQLLDAAGEALAGLDADLARGDTAALRGWMDEHVYRHGRAFTGVELVERVSGRALSVEPLVSYLDAKFPAASA
jgi:carboxypeptidase Taq